MKMPTRRQCLAVLLALSSMAGQPGLAQAQADFPKGTVRIVVPFPPGGPADSVGRLVAERLGALWKATVIVDNRPGASGTIGTAQVARAAPDGYTLLIAAGATNGSAEVLNPKTVTYRTLRDFSPVGFIGVTPSLMVVASHVKASDLKEYVAQCRANPGQCKYAQASSGSAPHFAFELLKMVAGVDILEVPFNGAAPAIQALAGGFVDTYMGSVFSTASLVQTGKARPIAVASAGRIEQYPNIPTFAEQGFPVEWDTWYGVLAPAGMAPALLERLNVDLRHALDGEEVRAQMARMGLQRKLGSTAQMSAAMKAEIENATRVAQQARMIKE